MKKVFFICLLLVSAFLIGSSGKALADACSDYQYYQCTRTETQYGEIDYIDTECVELCYDNGVKVYIEGFCFDGYLYPATDNKHLLGTANTCGGWAGCSVEFKGKSMTTKLTLIEADEGYIEILQCKPCDDCCK